MKTIICLLLCVSGALAAPTIDLGSDTLKFGSVSAGGGHTRPLAVGNTGDAALIVSAVDLGNAVFTLRTPALPDTIPPGQTHNYVFNFGPTDEISYDGVFSISSNDPLTPSAGLDVFARGVPAFSAGEIIWSYQAIENVVSCTAIDDVNGDGFEDVVAEAFDAGVSGDNLTCISGSGWGSGDLVWSARPQGGPSNSGGYGDECLITISDLNNNGTQDIVLGTAWGSRSVFAIEGTNGETIWSYDTYQYGPSGWFYSVAAMADLSGDSIPEVLAGAGSDANGGFCFDGATGARRWKFSAPDAIYTTCGTNDVNYDDIPDAIYGGGDNDDGVYCISGAAPDSARPLWTYHTNGSVHSVARITDVNWDGFFDVVAGYWYNGHKVVALSGYAPNGTPAVIWSVTVGQPIMKVVVCPDLNGDFYEDVLVASWGNFALALSGTTGAELWRNVAGDDVWAAHYSYDVTGDNFPEVISGAFTGEVFLNNGNNGEIIWSCATDSKIFTVRPIHDVNGDGIADVIAGQQYLNSRGGKVFVISGGTLEPSAIDNDTPQRPENTFLLSNYPNPFNAQTAISFDLPAASDVALEIYNITGQRVRGLLHGQRDAGSHRIVWDGRDDSGIGVASGSYFARLTAGEKSSISKMTVLK